MLGKVIIYILFALALGSTGAYFLSMRNNSSDKLIKFARYSYMLLFFGVILVSGYLLSNILWHRYDFTYIWSYSSNNLPLNLLISTFYAGQEGSFMLWTLMLAIVGAIILPYAKKHNYEAGVMGFYSLILVFLTIILIIKSPFEYVWDTFPNIEAGFMPPNGRGLNPILENYWITIHPPILFAGYSFMSVPFCFALAGLIKRDYKEWINISLPWTLASVAILGFGIMLGGFWAYETLGWGGFWGWDPVENSSLIPWIVGVALVHTMLVQKRTNGLIKTNFLLAIFAFILVIYATFLTRSGILGDISVHSFVDPGATVYWLLLSFLIIFLSIGVIGVIYRSKDLMTKTKKMSFDVTSKEFALSIGAVLLLASGLIVLLGTSYPILLDLMGLEKSGIDIANYNKWNLPIAVLIMLTNALSIYMNWRSSQFTNILKKVSIAALVSLAITIGSSFFGVTRIDLLLLGFASWFSLLVNLEFILRNIRKNVKFLGGFISHFGLSLFLLGVVSSGGFEQNKTLSFVKGEKHHAFGYDFTYIGYRQVELEKSDREKYEFDIKIEKANFSGIASPVFYWSDFNERQQAFLEPGISRKIDKDIYVSPKSLTTEVGSETIPMTKGSSSPIQTIKGISVQFEQFDMSHSLNTDQENAFQLGSIITLKKGDLIVTDTLLSVMNTKTGELNPIWKDYDQLGIRAGFLRFINNPEDMAQSQALIGFLKLGEVPVPPQQRVTVEVTFKPYINLVWIGVIMLVTGFFIAIRNHNVNQKTRLEIAEKKREYENSLATDPEHVPTGIGGNQTANNEPGNDADDEFTPIDGDSNK